MQQENIKENNLQLPEYSISASKGSVDELGI